MIEKVDALAALGYPRRAFRRRGPEGSPRPSQRRPSQGRGFSSIFGFAPCELCLQQRWAYYIGVPAARGRRGGWRRASEDRRLAAVGGRAHFRRERHFRRLACGRRVGLLARTGRLHRIRHPEGRGHERFPPANAGHEACTLRRGRDQDFRAVAGGVERRRVARDRLRSPCSARATRADSQSDVPTVSPNGYDQAVARRKWI